MNPSPTPTPKILQTTVIVLNIVLMYFIAEDKHTLCNIGKKNRNTMWLVVEITSKVLFISLFIFSYIVIVKHGNPVADGT